MIVSARKPISLTDLKKGKEQTKKLFLNITKITNVLHVKTWKRKCSNLATGLSVDGKIRKFGMISGVWGIYILLFGYMIFGKPPRKDL